ncbi:MAG: T9SS type A sorting domain-containing protein [Bacteroidia bacterium]|nr:T9SS type A sorting domain-containing protein [Bacteroidia bacterium]
MRKLSFFILLMALGSYVFGQSLRYIQPREKRNSAIAVPVPEEPNVTAQSPNGTGVPNGTILSDAVTAIKIGEASNFYTTLLDEAQALSVEPGVGTNGGAIAFIHRHNIGDCGGVTIDNGRLRYSISLDGGTSWNVGTPGTSTASNPPTVGCFGIGTLNPLYTRAARHPSILLDDPKETGNDDDLVLAYTGPVLVSVTVGFAGTVLRGSAINVDTDPNPMIVTEEEYFFGGQLYSLSLTERVPGEYWYVAPNYDGSSVTGTTSIYKGDWDTTTNTVNWSLVQTIRPNFISVGGTGLIGASGATGLSIGFDPAGKVGYVAGYGNLAGGVDSTLQIWMSESRNGGVSWANPERFPLENFPDVADTLTSRFIDTVTVANPALGLSVGDTVTAGQGLPGAQFAGVDLVVDANGNPHVMALLYNPFQHNGNGTYTALIGFITNGLELFYVDMTKDTAGNYQLLYLDYAENFWGRWGIIGDPDDEFSVTGSVQTTRSKDGELVFFTWTETPDTLSAFNDASNLITVALDVKNQTMTEIVDRTFNDGNFSGGALLPRTSQIALNTDTCTYTVPTVIADLDDGATLTQTNFWYFSDVSFNRCSDFTQSPRYFFNCLSAPITLNVTESRPDCGQGNGVLTAAASGGQGSGYTYSWDINGITVDSAVATNLSAGVYEVTVTDSRGCTSTSTTILSNQNAPDVTVGSVLNISCAGLVDGSAEANPVGGTAPYSYVWEHGETTKIASAIPQGTWQVVVTDANGCTSFSSVTITEPDAVNGTATSTDASCFGDTNGSVEAFASGGTPPYTYDWTGGIGNMQIVNNIGAGVYILTVTDANGCPVNDTVTVAQPDEIIADVTTGFNTKTTTPFDGSLTATPRNGATPYTYYWQILDSVDANDSTNFFWGDTIKVDQSDDRSQLQEAIACRYLLTVVDANGCTVETVGEIASFLGGATCTALLPTNLEKTFDGEVSLYPNPAKDILTIDVAAERLSGFGISLYDLSGKTVMSKGIEPTTNFSTTMDVSGLNSGVYLVKIYSESGVYTNKIMIMK